MDKRKNLVPSHTLFDSARESHAPGHDLHTHLTQMMDLSSCKSMRCCVREESALQGHYGSCQLPWLRFRFYLPRSSNSPVAPNPEQSLEGNSRPPSSNFSQLAGNRTIRCSHF